MDAYILLMSRGAFTETVGLLIGMPLIRPLLARI